MKDPTRARQQATKSVELAYKLAEAASAKSLESYLNHVVIDSRPEPKPFRIAADPWQWGLARQVIPPLEQISRISTIPYHGPLNFFYLLPRGHDKSSFIGRLLNGVLAFSKVPINAVAAAADRDQAAIIVQSMEAEARLNRWVAKRLRFSKYEVVGTYTNSQLKVISADAPTASGLQCDFILCDELCEWAKPDLFSKLYSGREKRFKSVFAIISNCGVKGEWQWDIWEEAQKDKEHWVTFQSPGIIASWLDREAMERQQKYITETEYLIKIKNEWLDPSVKFGFVPKSAIELCMMNSLAKGVQYRAWGDPDKTYVASIDYGPVKDRTVMSVMHQEKDGSVVIDRMDVWQGSRENRVRIDSVEQWIDEIRKNYRLKMLVIDPYQMEHTIQRYEGKVPLFRHEPRGGKSNFEAAQVMRGLLVEGKLLWYPGAGDTDFRGKQHGFHDELNELVVEKMGYGYRVNHLSNHHDDRYVSVSMGALWLINNRLKRPFMFNEHWL